MDDRVHHRSDPLPDTFDAADSNRDGKLSAEEIAAYFDPHYVGITQARRLVAAYDSDANGSLSAEELANATTEGAVILLDGGGIAIDMNVLLTSAIVCVRPSHLDRRQEADALPQGAGDQRCGSSSSTRLAGCVGSRSSTSLKYA